MNRRKICDVPFLEQPVAPGKLVLDPALGRLALYVSYYKSGRTGVGPALTRIDLEKHEYRSWSQPAGTGSAGMILCADGKIRFGMDGVGQLTCFDPISGAFEDVPHFEATHETTIFWDYVEGRDGRLYGGTYPSGTVVAFDQDTGRYHEYPIAADMRYAYALCVVDNGHIGVLEGSRHRVYSLNPETGEVMRKSPARLLDQPNAWSSFLRHGDEFLLWHPVDGGYEICRYDGRDLTFRGSFVADTSDRVGGRLISGPDGSLYLSVDGGLLYRIDKDKHSSELAFEIPGVPSRAVYYFLDESRILMAAASQYYGIYDIKTRQLDLRLARVEGNTPVSVLALLHHSNGQVYCAPQLGLGLSRVDPGKCEAEVLGLASDGSGEIFGLAEANGKVYAAAYTNAILAVYDPDQPWRPGREAHNNPRNLGPIGDQQYRPRAGIAVGPDGKLYIGTSAEYGARGGALTILDPDTNKWKVFRNLVRDHQVFGMAFGPGKVYLGTSVTAEGGLPPLDEAACLIGFDPKRGKVEQVVPIPGATSVLTMGYAAGKVFLGVAGRDHGPRVLAWDPGSRALRSVGGDGQYGALFCAPMAPLPGGRLAFAHVRGITRIDPATEELDVIWNPDHGEAPYIVLEASAQGLLFTAGNELWQMAH